MDKLIFLPVEDVRFSDLYDWSRAVERCKATSITLSPRKNHGVSVIKDDGKECGSLTRSNDKDIALFRVRRRVYAIKEECPHAGGPLHLGDIEDFGDDELCVRCPWHGWKINLETGMVLQPKGHEPQSTVVYKVKVTDEGRLYIGFEGLDKKYFNTDENNF